jgi:hypothetical protein
MGKIHLPPGGDLVRSVIDVCVSSDGKDSLEIVIGDPGYCLHAPDGYFKSPDLPTGAVDPQPPLILYPAVKSGKAYLAYFDSATNMTFVYVIKIQKDPCS